MDDAVQHNLNAMRFGDFATVVLISTLVAVCCGKEIQDIVHCRALRNSPVGQALEPRYLRALKGLEWVRQFALLPLVVAVVPILVMHRGADALSLCFNTLALLFLLGNPPTMVRGRSERLADNCESIVSAHARRLRQPRIPRAHAACAARGRAAHPQHRGGDPSQSHENDSHCPCYRGHPHLLA